MRDPYRLGSSLYSGELTWHVTYVGVFWSSGVMFWCLVFTGIRNYLPVCGRLRIPRDTPPQRYVITSNGAVGSEILYANAITHSPVSVSKEILLERSRMDGCILTMEELNEEPAHLFDDQTSPSQIGPIIGENLADAIILIGLEISVPWPRLVW